MYEEEKTKLRFSLGELKTLPVLDKFVNLKDLSASDNELTSLPSLNSLICLRRIEVWFNKLTSLPENVLTIFHHINIRSG